MDEYIKVLLDALKDTQADRASWESSSNYWKRKCEQAEAELKGLRSALSNKPNGSEA